MAASRPIFVGIFVDEVGDEDSDKGSDEAWLFSLAPLPPRRCATGPADGRAGLRMTVMTTVSAVRPCHPQV